MSQHPHKYAVVNVVNTYPQPVGTQVIGFVASIEGAKQLVESHKKLSKDYHNVEYEIYKHIGQLNTVNETD